uniref:RING-type domain-containing protein n=1 Tax=Callorhinchus milii TaxID=7868 RepID=A0A4W3GIK1_CALMI
MAKCAKHLCSFCLQVSVPLNSSWSVIPTRTGEPEATCSICLEFYTDPVTIDCGHNFCRDCILQCWGTGQGSVSCPQCRQQIPQRSVRPNRTLSNMVERNTVSVATQLKSFINSNTSIRSPLNLLN